MITIIGALGLVYPHRLGDVIGFICIALVIIMQKLRKDGAGPVHAAA